MAVVHHGNGMRTWIYNNEGHSVSFKADALELFNGDISLLDTARQHHGALLAYCAQPGWEETK
jgi:hypothetical protein